MAAFHPARYLDRVNLIVRVCEQKICFVRVITGISRLFLHLFLFASPSEPASQSYPTYFEISFLPAHIPSSPFLPQARTIPSFSHRLISLPFIGCDHLLTCSLENRAFRDKSKVCVVVLSLRPKLSSSDSCASLSAHPVRRYLPRPHSCPRVEFNQSEN